MREEAGEVGRVALRLAVEDARQGEVRVQAAQEAVYRRARCNTTQHIHLFFIHI